MAKVGDRRRETPKVPLADIPLGYERTKQRAKACNRYADEDDLPAARKVAIALQKMLATFYSLGQERFNAIPKELLEALFKIVTMAGNLSREMRRCSDVIYHWPPTFKDGMWSPDGSNEYATPHHLC